MDLSDIRFQCSVFRFQLLNFSLLTPDTRLLPRSAGYGAAKARNLTPKTKTEKLNEKCKPINEGGLLFFILTLFVHGLDHQREGLDNPIMLSLWNCFENPFEICIIGGIDLLTGRLSPFCQID